MSRTYRTLRVVRSSEGVLSVVIDAPPMHLIGPELVRDLVMLLGELESDQETRALAQDHWQASRSASLASTTAPWISAECHHVDGVLFLESSPDITGEILPIDGGRIARY